MQISIITVNMNNANGLKKTIDSVLSQTCRVDFVIIDGASIDGSAKLVEEQKNKLGYWVSEKDSGIYHAMNKGIKQANGNYLMFLNSGDTLVESTSIEKCLPFIETSTAADILYGNFILQSEVKPIAETLKRQPDQVSLLSLKCATLNHQAALFKATLFEEFGLYPEQYKLASDYWLFLLSLLGGKRFQYIDLAIANYNVDGASSVNYQAYAEEMALIWEQYVPEAIKNLVQENEELRKQASFRLVRYGAVANEWLLTIKRRWVV